jgi:hypothetical protein
LSFFPRPKAHSFGQLFHLPNAFIMKKNMGSTDKIIRIFLAAVLAALFFTKTMIGTLGYVALAVAAIFFLTSLVSFCPLYTFLGTNTCEPKSN